MTEAPPPATDGPLGDAPSPVAGTILWFVAGIGVRGERRDSGYGEQYGRRANRVTKKQQIGRETLEDEVSVRRSPSFGSIAGTPHQMSQLCFTSWELLRVCVLVLLRLGELTYTSNDPRPSSQSVASSAPHRYGRCSVPIRLRASWGGRRRIIIGNR